jgi:hypothetical protein
MCCTLKTGPFKNESIYIDFIKQLGLCLEQNMLIKLGEDDPSGPFITYKYKCRLCKKSWLLKIPDQAYRGGWYAEKKNNEH